MNPRIALKLAIDALRKQRSKVAFNANLYKKGVVTPRTEADAKTYQRLTDAISVLNSRCDSDFGG